MALTSEIEWTESTWNPVSGCTRVSEGCRHCYAERLVATRLQHTKKYAGLARKTVTGEPRWTGEVRLHEAVLDQPYSWRQPRLIFVNSMSDLFHERVPLDFIQRAFRVMNECSQHTFQILTKRPELARRYSTELTWGTNIWMGTSIENQSTVDRATELRAVPAHTRFLSLEPLLEPLPSLDLENIHWIIVGGESGPHARVMKAEWVRDLRDRCLALGIPFFFKQWGGVQKKRAGRELDGRTWDELPLGV